MQNVYYCCYVAGFNVSFDKFKVRTSHVLSNYFMYNTSNCELVTYHHYQINTALHGQIVRHSIVCYGQVSLRILSYHRPVLLPLLT